MSKAARAVYQNAVVNRPLPKGRPRGPAKVVRLHRASRAAYVFSEIVKAHITHPLPDQLQIAEQDLRAALNELLAEKIVLPPPLLQPTRRPMSPRLERNFLLISTGGFWAMMVVSALQQFGVL